MTEQRRSGFTLIEIVATLLLVVIGIGSVLAMSRLGLRWAGEAVSAASATMTAQVALADIAPGGRTADVGDGDGDGWALVSGDLSVAPGAAYDIVTAGTINGYYVRRSEIGQASDVISQGYHAADVTVDVFWGRDGRYVAGLKQRILRHR